MKRCAFLTMDNMEGFVSDDELAVAPLADLGWQVQFLSWQQTAVPWDEFDAAILRTTWDYQNQPTAFLANLEKINQATHLENNLDIVRWNMHKSYLGDLEQRGIGIVPTIWDEHLTASWLSSLFMTFNCDELVIKPVVGANADDTFRLPKTNSTMQFEHAVRIFQDRPYMVQPFMPGIMEEGEFSLFFFAGEYSHAILKTPKTDDFRVQEEHGGIIQAVEAEPRLIQRAKTAASAIDPQPLYARVDMVRTAVNDFVVMELELIEPSLYLRMDPHAPERFAKAIDTWFTKPNQP